MQISTVVTITLGWELSVVFSCHVSRRSLSGPRGSSVLLSCLQACHSCGLQDSYLIQALRKEVAHKFGFLVTDYVHFDHLIKAVFSALAGVAQLVETLSRKLKGCWFDPQSEHLPTLWPPPGVARMGGNWSIFLSCTSVSLSPPSPTSIKAMKEISLGEDKK